MRRTHQVHWFMFGGAAARAQQHAQFEVLLMSFVHVPLALAAALPRLVRHQNIPPSQPPAHRQLFGLDALSILLAISKRWGSPLEEHKLALCLHSASGVQQERTSIDQTKGSPAPRYAVLENCGTARAPCKQSPAARRAIRREAFFCRRHHQRIALLTCTAMRACHWPPPLTAATHRPAAAVHCHSSSRDGGRTAALQRCLPVPAHDHI